MAVVARYPDCTGCEAPCCRRQFMENDDGWFKLSDIRPIYQEAGTDVHVVGWAHQPDGRQDSEHRRAHQARSRCAMMRAPASKRAPTAANTVTRSGP